MLGMGYCVVQATNKKQQNGSKRGDYARFHPEQQANKPRIPHFSCVFTYFQRVFICFHTGHGTSLALPRLGHYAEAIKMRDSAKETLEALLENMSFD